VTTFDLRVEGLRFTLPVKAAWARPENAFCRIENLQAETHRPYACDLLEKRATREPIRLLSIRAPRQRVLRTSFWLASSGITTRPCDLPVQTTHDASNRLLPPKRN
jgi:hypothetical protein